MLNIAKLYVERPSYYAWTTRRRTSVAMTSCRVSSTAALVAGLAVSLGVELGVRDENHTKMDQNGSKNGPVSKIFQNDKEN